ncbi:MAG TPA: P-loop NTPase, partial [Pirellulaceae bacterium]|nr:P-loop NTPase [Pirellulaceae bacterium]
RPAFAAAWEVDQFDWPKTCDELLAKSGQEFQLAAARFKAATAEGLRVLAVTSLMRREGRSTVAMSLARAAANEGVRVALVDADLDHPQLGLSVGFEATSGWSEAVTDNLPLGETAVSSVSDRLTLFPLVSGQSRRPLALNSPSVTELIDELTRCFELVIIDMGPLTGPAERGFEGGLRCPLDAAILVRDVRLTSHDQAVHAARQLRHAGVGAVGIVENFVLH